MSDPEADLEAIERAAAELLPQLSERLGRHRLGEIEVSRGDLRLRVAGTPAPAELPASAAPASPPKRAEAAQEDTATPASPVAPGAAGSHGVTSPAVGYFVYAEGLGPGLGVEKGDGLGYVEMLGVRHDVLAPRSGTVRHLVAESGEAVEYGQVVVELEPAEVGR